MAIFWMGEGTVMPFLASAATMAAGSPRSENVVSDASGVLVAETETGVALVNAVVPLGVAGASVHSNDESPRSVTSQGTHHLVIDAQAELGRNVRCLVTGMTPWRPRGDGSERRRNLCHID